MSKSSFNSSNFFNDQQSNNNPSFGNRDNVSELEDNYDLGALNYEKPSRYSKEVPTDYSTGYKDLFPLASLQKRGKLFIDGKQYGSSNRKLDWLGVDDTRDYSNPRIYKQFQTEAYRMPSVQQQLFDLYSRHLSKPQQHGELREFNIKTKKNEELDPKGAAAWYNTGTKNLNVYLKKPGVGENPAHSAVHEMTHAFSDLDTKYNRNIQPILFPNNRKISNNQIKEMQDIIDPERYFSFGYKPENLISGDYPDSSQSLWDADEFNGHIAQNIHNQWQRSSNDESNEKLTNIIRGLHNTLRSIGSKKYPDIDNAFKARIDEIKPWPQVPKGQNTTIPSFGYNLVPWPQVPKGQNTTIPIGPRVQKILQSQQLKKLLQPNQNPSQYAKGGHITNHAAESRRHLNNLRMIREYLDRM